MKRNGVTFTRHSLEIKHVNLINEAIEMLLSILKIDVYLRHLQSTHKEEQRERL